MPVFCALYVKLIYSQWPIVHTIWTVINKYIYIPAIKAKSDDFSLGL